MNNTTIEVYQENTHTFTLTVLLSGAAFDLTGYTCNFIVRRTPTSAKLIDFNLDAGDINTNILTVNLTAVHTDLELGAHLWEMRISKAGGRTETIVQGILNVKDSLI